MCRIEPEIDIGIFLRHNPSGKKIKETDILRLFLMFVIN